MKRSSYGKITAAVMLIALTAASLSACGTAARNVSSPSYPKQKDRSARYEAAEKLAAPADFYKTSAAELLSDKGSGLSENRVYSPVNIYMSLAMLAEAADGNSRGQILSALGESDINSLRAQAANMWNANYRDDGTDISVLANSLWLNRNLKFDKDTAKTLSDNYFASVYSCNMTSESSSKALRKWLDKQTGGFLKDSVSSAQLSPDTVMALCSTVYFRARWMDEFSPKNNDTKMFHGKNSDTETTFMNSFDYQRLYYYGEDFGSITLSFKNGGAMRLILPDEDKTVEDVLASGEYIDMITSGRDWEKKKEMKVYYSVPKFDIFSDTELSEGLEKLGVTDVFDKTAADFSPIAPDVNSVYITCAKHAARVTIDEEGCTAAAYTEMMAGVGSAVPPELEEIYFILDRPFIFVITSDAGQPLFIGAANQL